MFSYSPIIQNLKAGDDYHLDVLRLDLIDPEISGNKWFKLKHNFEAAKAQGLSTVLTFGGAHSNHIAATAAAGKTAGFKTVGIIRGEKPETLSPTLLHAQEQGMILDFLSRETYDQKNTEAITKYLHKKFGEHYLVPEGGGNKEGIMGCMEIMKPGMDHEYVFCACGTGTTFGGLVLSAKADQHVIGISVLKGENKLPGDTMRTLSEYFPDRAIELAGNESLSSEILSEHTIVNSYCFKGYASCDDEVIMFRHYFENEYKVPLDYVYTSKLFFAVFDLMKKQKLRKGSKILVIHSGGLQGNEGFERRYQLKPIL